MSGYIATEYITTSSVIDVENVNDSSLFMYDDIKFGWAVTNSESIELTDDLSLVLGLLISDWLTLIDSQTNNWNGRDIINDTLNLYDLSQSAQLYTAAIDESLVMTDAALLKLTIAVLENLGFTELVTALKTMASTVSDTVALTDSADMAFSLLIQEALSSVDVASVVTTFLGSISDTMGIADAVAPIKTAYPSISESLKFTETVSSRGTLYSAIYDTIHMNVSVDISGEVYECYVLNTPKFMPSMYSGFDFNSYAVFENRAFGANATGIYELTGETDAGANISTGVVMSETDFGMPNQKRFRRGYLGISGTSPVMVLETGDGSREAYAIDTNGKIVASHELKSKRWKLSVANFDELETIKLIPVILTK
jgi:hypothetical protein